MATTTYVPEDMLVKILSKLPPKSLLCFRVVSKSWLSLIGNLLFDSLLNPSPTTTQNSHLIVERTVLSPAPEQIYCFLSHNTLDAVDDDCISQIPLDLPPDPKIVGSCNGLVCLVSKSERDIFLWNPATSAVKALPYSVTATSYLDNVCFGFNAKSEDFKVMRVYHTQIILRSFEIDDVLEYSLNPKAEVYSLSSGCWRKLNVLDDVPPSMWKNSKLNVRDVPPSYANGVCFWWKMYDRDGTENIVAFDVTQEEFKTTSLPDASVIGDPYDTHRHLAVLNESLALIINKNKYLDIWVLFEFGVRESWTRLVTITTFFLGLERPLGFWKDGELFIENAEGQLLLFHPFTQTVRSLPVDDGVRESLQVFLYTPSSFPIPEFVFDFDEDYYNS